MEQEGAYPLLQGAVSPLDEAVVSAVPRNALVVRGPDRVCGADKLRLVVDVEKYQLLGGAGDTPERPYRVFGVLVLHWGTVHPSCGQVLEHEAMIFCEYPLRDSIIRVPMVASARLTEDSWASPLRKLAAPYSARRATLRLGDLALNMR